MGKVETGRSLEFTGLLGELQVSEKLSENKIKTNQPKPNQTSKKQNAKPTLDTA